MESTTLQSAVSTSMLSKTLDMHQATVTKLINSVPQMPQNDGMRVDSRASQGIGQNLDIVA